MKIARCIVPALIMAAGFIGLPASAALISEVAMDGTRQRKNALEITDLAPLKAQGIEQVSLLVVNGTAAYRGHVLSHTLLPTTADTIAVLDQQWPALDPAIPSVQTNLMLSGSMGARIVLLYAGAVDVPTGSNAFTSQFISFDAPLLDYVVIRASTSDPDLSDDELTRFGGAELNRAASTRTLLYSSSSLNHVRYTNQHQTLLDWAVRTDAPTPGEVDPLHVPEPTTLAMFAAAGVVLVRRRGHR